MAPPRIAGGRTFLATLPALLIVSLEDSRAGDAEAEVLSRLDVRGNHDDRLRVGHGLELLRIFGREGHALGHHDDEVLHVVQRLGREAGLAAIRHVIGNLELGFAGTQRIAQQVVVLLRAGRSVSVAMGCPPGPLASADSISAPSGRTISKVPLSLACVRGGSIYC